MSDRPLECNCCQKAVKVLYKEVQDGHISCVEMCEDCPMLEEKLHGKARQNSIECQKEDSQLFCANCKTSLATIKTGSPVGCSQCYHIFAEILIEDLLHQGKVSSSEIACQELHKGKIAATPRPQAIQMGFLQTQLESALQQEKYEEAAEIRDRIKKLEGYGHPS